VLLGGRKARSRTNRETNGVGWTCKGVWSHLSAGVGVAGKLDGATEVSLGRPRGHWGHVALLTAGPAAGQGQSGDLWSGESHRARPGDAVSGPAGVQKLLRDLPQGIG